MVPWRTTRHVQQEPQPAVCRLRKVLAGNVSGQQRRLPPLRGWRGSSPHRCVHLGLGRGNGINCLCGEQEHLVAADCHDHLHHHRGPHGGGHPDHGRLLELVSEVGRALEGNLQCARLGHLGLEDPQGGLCRRLGRHVVLRVAPDDCARLCGHHCRHDLAEEIASRPQHSVLRGDLQHHWHDLSDPLCVDCHLCAHPFHLLQEPRKLRLLDGHEPLCDLFCGQQTRVDGPRGHLHIYLGRVPLPLSGGACDTPPHQLHQR
mmetsp:Transcript_88515/g.285891  ORF Transcript_88515/g.285891 Transcript_88515/m.285891 type:complete len:260 (-) Transcript_88515:1886-2665(-)